MIRNIKNCFGKISILLIALLICASGTLNVRAEGEGCGETCANGICYNPCTGEITTQDPNATVARKTILDYIRYENSLLMTIVNYVLAAGMIFAVIMIILGAIKLAGANITGMPHERIKGYNTIKVALIGLILIGAFGLIVNAAYRVLR